jgi:hypothetical protein
MSVGAVASVLHQLGICAHQQAHKWQMLSFCLPVVHRAQHLSMNLLRATSRSPGEARVLAFYGLHAFTGALDCSGPGNTHGITTLDMHRPCKREGAPRG